MAVFLAPALAGFGVAVPASAAPSAAGCAVTAAAAPTCGRWWGEAVDPGATSLLSAVGAAQASTGRRLDIIHTYHRWNDPFPTSQESVLAHAGHLLLIGWKPIDDNGQLVHWSDIADGSQDTVITAEAERLRSLNVPVLLAFSYEPEHLVGRAGTAPQFAAAFRHVHDVMVHAGADNVRFVWTVMGLDSAYWHTGYHQLWPGSSYVDWIAWDPYNWSSCRHETSESFNQMVGPFYRWVTGQHFGSEPLMLAEYGTVERQGDPGQKGAWFAGESSALDRFPRLKALVYFNLRAPPASCDWLSATSTTSAAGFRSLARSAAFAPSASLPPALLTAG